MGSGRSVLNTVIRLWTLRTACNCFSTSANR